MSAGVQFHTTREAGIGLRALPPETPPSSLSKVGYLFLPSCNMARADFNLLGERLRPVALTSGLGRGEGSTAVAAPPCSLVRHPDPTSLPRKPVLVTHPFPTRHGQSRLWGPVSKPSGRSLQPREKKNPCEKEFLRSQGKIIIAYCICY